MGFAASDSGRRAPRLVRDQVATALVDRCPGQRIGLAMRSASPTLVGRPIAPERHAQSCSSSPTVSRGLLGPGSSPRRGRQRPHRDPGGQGAPAPRPARRGLGAAGHDERADRHAVGRRSAGQRRQVGADLRPAAAQRARARPAAAPRQCCSPRARATGSRWTRARSTPSGSRASRAIGQRALADGRPDSAGRTLTEALALWRGPAYAGFDADFAHAEARRLEELRLAVTEDRVAAELALGRAAQSVPELERLVGEHPHRERLWEMLVTALYRSGRQGDALGAYERARVLLADELGVDPGPGLRSVHARVLATTRPSGHPHTDGRPSRPSCARRRRSSVGDGELERLRDAWQRAVRGRPGTVVVRGPAGGGGSALAAALAAEVAREGAVVRYAGPVPPARWRQPRRGYVAPRRPAFAPGRRPRSGPRGSDARPPADRPPRRRDPRAPRSSTSAPLGLRHVREIVADYVTPDVVDVVDGRGAAPLGRLAGRGARGGGRRGRARVPGGGSRSRPRPPGPRAPSLPVPRAELADNVALLQDTETSLEPRRPGELPVAGSGGIRRRGRAVVRRPRAPRRRAGGPAGGHQAARPRRRLRLGEVLGPAGRTPGGAPP